MKWKWVSIIAGMFAAFGAVSLYLSYTGIFPIIPTEMFLPRVRDKEQLIYECRELISEQEQAERWSPILAREDYPREIKRLEARSVHVWEDEVIIGIWSRNRVLYGYIVRPEEEVVRRFRGGTYRGGV